MLTLHAAWIDSFEENDGQSIPSRVRDLLLPAPPQTHFAQHHYCPTKPERRRSQDGFVESDDEVSHEILPKLPERSFFGGPKEPDKGRKWDHVREGEPVIVQSGVPNISSRWRNFVKSSMYGPLLEEDGKLVETSFLDEQTPGYTRPWRGDLEGEDPEKLLGLRPSKRRRRMWYERVQVRISQSLMVPLLLIFVVYHCYASTCSSFFPSHRPHDINNRTRAFKFYISSNTLQLLQSKSFHNYGNRR